MAYDQGKNLYRHVYLFQVIVQSSVYVCILYHIPAADTERNTQLYLDGFSNFHLVSLQIFSAKTDSFLPISQWNDSIFIGFYISISLNVAARELTSEFYMGYLAVLASAQGLNT